MNWLQSMISPFTSRKRMRLLIILVAVMSVSILSVLSSMCSFWPRCRTIDLLTATASDLQIQLTAGRITSSELVSLCFGQIQKHDAYLRAVLAKSPEAIRQAESLDEERRSGLVRGPLHGIPILLKDNIATHFDLGMDTTGGTFALEGSRPRRNAELVDRLIAAGMIILGKANLSELSGFKGVDIMPGWSAVGGQTQSAYTVGDVDLTDNGLGHSSPGGSSTGSAVSVSAGFSPVALGTDTGGSLITPCTRASLYTIRPTAGLISQNGIIPISHLFDTAGPIAKSSIDLANLLDVLVNPAVGDKGSYAMALPGTFRDIRIGALSPEDWLFGPDLQRPAPTAREQMIRDTKKAYKKLKRLAKSFQEVTLVSVKELQINGVDSFYDIQTARFRKTLETYLEDLEISKVHTLDSLIRFNKDHAKKELPLDYSNQDQLIAAANANMSDAEHDRLLQHARTVSRERGIDYTLKKYGVDVIIAPADSAVNLLVSAAGYPSATMPLSYLDYNGRPFGLVAFTKANGEKTLLKALSAWEATFPKRRRPPPKIRG